MAFLSELSFNDLQRLRRLVKQVHLRFHPKDKLTDREADRLIETLGPEIMEQDIKRAMEVHGDRLVLD